MVYYANNFRCRPLCLWALLVLFVTAPVPSIAQEEVSIKEKFLKVAPGEWLVYEAFLRSLQGDAKIITVREGTTVYSAIWTIRQNPQCRLVIRQREAYADRPADSTSGMVSAYNPSYAFTLRRERKENDWALKALGAAKNDAAFQSLVTETDEASSFLGIFLRVGPTYLSGLVRQESFRLLDAKLVKHKGAEAVRIDFDNSHPLDAKGEFVPIQEGTLVLDPIHHWVLLAAEVKMDFSNTKRNTLIEINYRTKGMKIQIPQDATEELDGMNTETNKAFREKTRYEYDLHEPKSFPEYQEFTMSAFGLPEPMGMPAVDRGIRWHLWLSLAAAAVLVGGGLVVIFKRRYSRSGNAMPEAKPK